MTCVFDPSCQDILGTVLFGPFARTDIAGRIWDTQKIILSKENRGLFLVIRNREKTRFLEWKTENGSGPCAFFTPSDAEIMKNTVIPSEPAWVGNPDSSLENGTTLFLLSRPNTLDAVRKYNHAFMDRKNLENMLIPLHKNQPKNAMAVKMDDRFLFVEKEKTKRNFRWATFDRNFNTLDNGIWALDKKDRFSPAKAMSDFLTGHIQEKLICYLAAPNAAKTEEPCDIRIRLGPADVQKLKNSLQTAGPERKES